MANAEQRTDGDVPAGVVDLLGVLAYGELSAFGRLAEDARLAPTLHLTGELSRMAARELEHHDLLVGRLRELGQDPEVVMNRFVPGFEAFHQRTRPATWLEGLVKAYVGDGIALDFYGEAARFVDDRTREVIERARADDGKTDLIVDTVRGAVAVDPRVGGRLALWARRLVGEALSQGQRVAAEHDSLVELLVGGGRDGVDLGGLGAMFTRLTDAHTERLSRLGLSS